MKHWLARAARGTVLALISEVAVRAANTIFFLLLTWHLGEAEAGAYSLGFTFAGLLMQVSLGGLDQILSRNVIRDPQRGALTLGNFLLARLISSVLCYAALALWLFRLSSYNGVISQVVLVFGATLIPDSLIILCQGYLIAHDRVGAITILGILTGGFKLAIGTLILTFGGDAFAVAWVILFTSILTLALYLALIIIRLEWPSFSFNRDFWLPNAREELPLLIIAILFTIEGTFDTLLLSSDGNIVEVGVYAAATALLTPLLLLPQSYRQIILPIMTAWYDSARERAYDIYRQSTRIALIVALLASTSLTLVADQALPLLFQNHFSATVPVLRIVIWSFVFISLLVPNGRLLLVAGRQAVIVPIQAASMLLNIGLNVLLQPAIGAQGAAIARVSSTALTFIACLIYVQLKIYRWNVLPTIARPALAAVFLALTTLGLRWLEVHWLLGLTAGWLVYCVTLFVLQSVSIAELRGLFALIRRGGTPIITE